MPAFLQASMSNVPGAAVTFFPSTIMFTSAIEKPVSSFQFLVSRFSKKSKTKTQPPSRRSVCEDRQEVPLPGGVRIKGTRLAFKVVFKFLAPFVDDGHGRDGRSEEHTSELQSRLH